MKAQMEAQKSNRATKTCKKQPENNHGIRRVSLEKRKSDEKYVTPEDLNLALKRSKQISDRVIADIKQEVR